MKRFTFYLIYPFLICISLLPFPLLYLLADFLYFLMYYVVGYRKKVVYYNLKLSFPRQEEREIHQISTKYYKHLADLMVESVKGFTISEKQLTNRVTILDDVLKTEFDKGKSIILLLGHYGNWEWAGTSASIQTYHKMHIVYHELSNAHFDQLYKKTRSKFGAHLSEMKQVARNLIKLRNEKIATALVADQNPHPDSAVWVDFLHRKTAFFPGPEKIAQKFNQPVYYVHVTKIKRGYYQLLPVLIPDGEKNLIQEYASRLEKDILKKPEYWLWSHRRWKHKFEDYH